MVRRVQISEVAAGASDIAGIAAERVVSERSVISAAVW